MDKHVSKSPAPIPPKPQTAELPKAPPPPPPPEPPKQEQPPAPAPEDKLAIEPGAQPRPDWKQAVSEIPGGDLAANFLSATGGALVAKVKETVGKLWEDHKPEFFKPFEISEPAKTPAPPLDPAQVEAKRQALTPEQRQQYDAVMAKLQEPPNAPCPLGDKLEARQKEAREALQQMLLDGRLPGPTDPVAGKTLLENLQGIAGQPMAPGIDNGRLLTDVVLETSDPARIAQGAFNCCGAGSAEQVLASTNPAEYARIAAGLASPEGKVKTQGGLELTRHPQWQVGTDDASNPRSLNASIMMPTFMQAMNHLGSLGSYENREAGDGLLGGDGTRVPFTSDMTVPGVLPANQGVLLSNLTGQRYVGQLGNGLGGGPADTTLTLLSGQRDPWQQARPDHPITVAVNYNTGGQPDPQPHYLVVTGYDPVTHKCSILNPHGKRQEVDEEQLRSHLIGASC